MDAVDRHVRAHLLIGRNQQSQTPKKLINHQHTNFWTEGQGAVVVHYLEALGELVGVQHIGELGHRVRLRRVVGSVRTHVRAHERQGYNTQ